MTQNVLSSSQTVPQESGGLDRSIGSLIPMNWETIAWIVLMLLAVVSRFYDLGARAMSHDESLHALYSFYLYDNGNYDHNPMMHGPLLFHLNAITYFFFGDNDYTARIIPALSGLGVILMTWTFRPYIGRLGALIAATLLLISPSMLYHSRYIRNDMYIALFTMIWIYGAFRYLDTRRLRYLTVMMVGMAFGFVSKENHFISGAIIGSFFAALALWQVLKVRSLIIFAVASVTGVAWYVFHILARGAEDAAATEAVVEGAEAVVEATSRALLPEYIALGIGSLIILVLLGIFLAMGKNWKRLINNSAMDLAVLMLTLIMPFLAPIGHAIFGWDPLAKATNEELMRSAGLVLFFTAVAAIIAALWFGLRVGGGGGVIDDDDVDAADALIVANGAMPTRLGFFGWLQNFAIFWAIQILFFTTFLTNAKDGLATGIVGSLGYWMAQQEVARGGQPWYYYPMIGGLYEFLPIILSGVGIAIVFYHLVRNRDWDPMPAVDSPPLEGLWPIAADQPRVASPVAVSDDSDDEIDQIDDLKIAQVEKKPVLSDAVLRALPEHLRQNRVYFLLFSIWWVVMSWVAYTVAGEKMPWLLVHMAQPMCILGGWYLGRLINRVDWATVRQSNAIWLVGLAPALLYTLFRLFFNLPFGADRSIGDLSGTIQWVLTLIVLAAIVYLIVRWTRSVGGWSAARLLSVGVVALLLMLTVRFSYMLTYINYDMATEYLVYAHGGPDLKRALSEIDLISERTVGGRNIVVAYDDDSSWPLSWYMRQYPNSVFYGGSPNNDSMSAPIIIVGNKNYDKVRPYVARDYVKRTYRQVWWPDQGYFYLTFDRFWSTIRDPEKMERIAQIVFYRRHRNDNTEVEGEWRDLTLWPNRHDFEMYVRRDLASEVWDLGVAPLTTDGANMFLAASEKEIDLSATMAHNQPYDGLGLVTPRSVAAGTTGVMVIADSGNHRLVLLNSDGTLIRTVGSRCSLGEGAEGGCIDPDGADGPLELGDGQFNEPWGVAVDQTGNIFVADTWNGRIQVFDADGNFLRKWGVFSTTDGELGDAYRLFGPRSVAVDSNGGVYVTDTGNKRIIHYSDDGQLIQQIGGGGVIGGRFEEPVGIAVDQNDGSVYVADAWNQRIQKLSPSLEFVAEFPIPGWESQSIYHKPYVAVAPNGDVYASDPEFVRIYVYTSSGEIKASFGNIGSELNQFMLPTGLGIDSVANALLVADADNNRVLSFPLVQ